MSAMLEQAFDRLNSCYREGHTLVLLFDYDGTLTPIVQHPTWARLALEMRQVLTGLLSRPSVRVGILSGRSLDDLKDLVGIPDLFYVGTGGLELEYGGIRSVHPDAARTTSLLAEVATHLGQIVEVCPGAWVEPKPFGLTVHFRDTDPRHIEELQCRVARSLDTFASALRVLPGPMATEIIPDLGWNKGTAVRWIVHMLGSNCTVLYAGDHANDAEAFAVTNALNGVTVAIGLDAPAEAQYSLPDPPALSDFLQQLLEHITD